jgi:hypothetical protein
MLRQSKGGWDGGRYVLAPPTEVLVENPLHILRNMALWFGFENGDGEDDSGG